MVKMFEAGDCHPVLKAWMVEMHSIGLKAERLPFSQMLLYLARASKSLFGFIGQLTWAFSIKLEKELGSQVKSPASESHAIGFAWQDEAEWDGSTQDRSVCQYVMRGVEQMGALTSLGCATDKGWAKGTPYQVTVFGLETNFACVAVPQVDDLDSGVCVAIVHKNLSRQCVFLVS